MKMELSGQVGDAHSVRDSPGKQKTNHTVYVFGKCQPEGLDRGNLRIDVLR